MIDKIYDMYCLCCDVCGEIADKDFFSFYEAVNYKKQNGWKSQRHRGVWMDICPECQKGDKSG